MAFKISLSIIYFNLIMDGYLSFYILINYFYIFNFNFLYCYNSLFYDIVLFLNLIDNDSYSDNVICDNCFSFLLIMVFII